MLIYFSFLFVYSFAVDVTMFSFTFRAIRFFNSAVQFRKTYFLFARWEIKTLLIIILYSLNCWHAFCQAKKICIKTFWSFVSSSKLPFLFPFFSLDFFLLFSSSFNARHSNSNLQEVFISNQSLPMCCFLVFAWFHGDRCWLFTVCCIQLKISSKSNFWT